MKYIFHGNLEERFCPKTVLVQVSQGRGNLHGGGACFSPGGQVFFSVLFVLPGIQATEGAPCVVIYLFLT